MLSEATQQEAAGWLLDGFASSWTVASVQRRTHVVNFCEISWVALIWKRVDGLRYGIARDRYIYIYIYQKNRARCTIKLARSRSPNNVHIYQAHVHTKWRQCRKVVWYACNIGAHNNQYCLFSILHNTDILASTYALLSATTVCVVYCIMQLKEAESERDMAERHLRELRQEVNTITVYLQHYIFLLWSHSGTV